MELEQVVGGGDQPPFRANGAASSSSEAVQAAVELHLREHGLDHRLALAVERAAAISGQHLDPAVGRRTRPSSGAVPRPVASVSQARRADDQKRTTRTSAAGPHVHAGFRPGKASVSAQSAETLEARLYEGGPEVKALVPLRQLADTVIASLPGERCRVKRLSKFTGVNVGWLMALDTTA